MKPSALHLLTMHHTLPKLTGPDIDAAVDAFAMKYPADMETLADALELAHDRACRYLPEPADSCPN